MIIIIICEHEQEREREIEIPKHISEFYSQSDIHKVFVACF